MNIRKYKQIFLADKARWQIVMQQGAATSFLEIGVYERYTKRV
jgi:hypothetical protein